MRDSIHLENLWLNPIKYQVPDLPGLLSIYGNNSIAAMGCLICEVFYLKRVAVTLCVLVGRGTHVCMCIVLKHLVLIKVTQVNLCSA